VEILALILVAQPPAAICFASLDYLESEAPHENQIEIAYMPRPWVARSMSIGKTARIQIRGTVGNCMRGAATHSETSHGGRRRDIEPLRDQEMPPDSFTRGLAMAR